MVIAVSLGIIVVLALVILGIHLGKGSNSIVALSNQVHNFHTVVGFVFKDAISDFFIIKI